MSSKNSLSLFSLFITVIVCWLFLSPLMADEQVVKFVDVSRGERFERPLLLLPKPGSSALVIVEQGGRIYTLRQKRGSKKALFLDISHKVLRKGNEEGLLGMAFAPDFERSGAFYLYYSAADPRRTVLSRFRVKTEASLKADGEFEEVLLELEQPYSNHNGGHLEFGPDGALYIGVGDGGARDDPHGNGQNGKTLLGSLLRIDPSKRGEKAPYAIPSDNPFVGKPDVRDEIYALGLRNPWRFAFDSVTGDLWLGDVGQDQYEEVNIIRAGGNYGWVVMEASHCYRPRLLCGKARYDAPVHEYGREMGASITGGRVYRGHSLPKLQGQYIFGDFVSGRVWALRRDKSGSAVVRQRARISSYISSFGEGADGELYLTAFDGKIYKMEKGEE